MSRRSYGSPGLLDGVLGLLRGVFPGFTEAEAIARRRGLRWEECSTPFVVDDGGEIVAHVGLLAMTCLVDGAERSIGGVHAVATRPDHRGRGHALRLLREAVAWGRARHDALVLTTSAPGLYEKAGFRIVPEHRFVCSSPPPAGSERGRWLDLDVAADLELLDRLLETRQPVSDVVGVVRGRDVFLFATAKARLLWLPELECVAWTSRRDGTLVLHDLVAPRVPALAELMACLAGPVEQVVAEFRPDRLAADFAAEPHVLDGDDHLMTHGDLLRPGPTVALPRTARC